MLYMTTLFNTFSPIIAFNIKFSLKLIMFVYFTLLLINGFLLKNNLVTFFHDSYYGLMYHILFLFISLMNLYSLSTYSFPLTTMLIFNLCMSFSWWISSMIPLLSKEKSFSSFLPSNTPWYLCVFLCFIELMSMSVRPLTLCFRLMANIMAGHVLLSLISKMAYFTWTVGILFTLLEIMVCIIQGYVFTLLVKVYLEESLEG